MQCPRCRSMNVNVQIVSDVRLVNKHHGIFWWIFVGWWWVPVKWIIFTVPALLAKIFIPKRQKIKQTNRRVCICQNCGYQWNL
ncbi:MAG: hypothetical protein II882_04535 [Lachnospiraceae bacterium]|nr:hypothetical protein [Lachnospiraceae bacterium]